MTSRQRRPPGYLLWCRRLQWRVPRLYLEPWDPQRRTDPSYLASPWPGSHVVFSVQGFLSSGTWMETEPLACVTQKAGSHHGPCWKVESSASLVFWYRYVRGYKAGMGGDGGTVNSSKSLRLIYYFL